MIKPKHSFFTKAKEGDNSIFSYFFTLLAVIAAVFIGNFFYVIYVSVAGNMSEFTQENMVNFEALEISEPMGLGLLLIPFALGFFILPLMVKWLHKRPSTSIFTSASSINWSKFFFGFGVYLVLSIIAESIMYIIDPSNYVFSFDASIFFPLLLVVLIMIPLQASFEEIAFRGYLMQLFGLLSKNAGVALLLTSTLFGLMHIMNTEVQAFGDWIVSYYIASGIAFGIIAIMDEGLELAMGVHSANNIFGSVLVTFPESSLQTSALFQVKEYDLTIMMAMWLVIMTIFIIIVAKKYQWKDFSKLWSRIEF